LPIFCEVRKIDTALPDVMRYKNPTPNLLPASDEGAKMYLIREKTAVDNVGIRVWEKSGFWMATGGEPIPRLICKAGDGQVPNYRFAIWYKRSNPHSSVPAFF
jgi:hypothetical protein